MSLTPTIDFKMIDMLRRMRPSDAPDPVVTISEIFAVESASRLQQLMRAWTAGDQPALRALAFTFKGMSCTIGASRLYELSREIETAAPGTLGAGQFKQLGEEVQRVSAALTSAAEAVH